MDKRKKAVIFGTASFAEVAHVYLSKESDYRVVAFTATREYLKDSTFQELPLVAFDDVEKRYPPSEHEMFIAVGYVCLNKIRERFYREAKGKGYRLLTYISPDATVWSRDIGENCFIFEHNVIQPFTSIGNDVIVWSGNHIGHHSRIDDHCYITSHVVISGHCHVGSYTFIGVNATLRDNLTIGRENIIGAGALMLKSTGDQEVYGEKGTERHAKGSSDIRTI